MVLRLRGVIVHLATRCSVDQTRLPNDATIRAPNRLKGRNGGPFGQPLWARRLAFPQHGAWGNRLSKRLNRSMTRPTTGYERSGAHQGQSPSHDSDLRASRRASRQ